MGLAQKHLSEHQRIEIARSLFKVTKDDSHKGELHGLCPIHDEKNSSFSYNYRKDLYFCLACGAGGDLIRLFCEVHGYGQKDGFKAFSDKYGLDIGPDKSKAARSGNGRPTAVRKDEFIPEDEFKRLPALPDPWVDRLVKTRGWTREVIQEHDLRLHTNPRSQEQRIAIPIRDGRNRLLNIRLYLPGAARHKVISYSIGEGKKKTFGTARLLPDPAGFTPETVWLCEGESDYLCARSHGLQAITQTAGAGSWKDEFTPHFEGRDVVIAYDADLKGINAARKIAKKLAKVARLVRIIHWPDWMGRENGQWPKDHGQDLTDFFVTHKRTLADLNNLLATAETIAPDADPEPADGPRRFFVRGANGRSLSFKPNLLAQEILAENDLVTDPETGLVYRWSGAYWKEINIRLIRRMALQKLGMEGTRSRAEDVASQVADLALLDRDTGINPHPNLLCLMNGVLNLDDMSLGPHLKEHYITYQLGVSFHPRTPAKAPRWLDFLLETVQREDVIDELQEFFGYCLTRETRYEMALLLVGPGSDGKSTTLNILQALIGDANCANVDLSYLDNEFHRASLHGKLLNVATEVESQVFTSGYFKAIVSGDSLNAAFKHQPVFEFRPVCKLAFSSNRFPKVQDNSHGFFRRILPVKFLRQIPPEERDPHLIEKLLAELDGIFAWAIEGLVRLRKRGFFKQSGNTREVLNEYRASNNPVLGFVDDCTTTENLGLIQACVTKSDLYGAYQEYCRRFGFGALNEVHFARELNEIVPGLTTVRPRSNKGRRERVWQGIRLEKTD